MNHTERMDHTTDYAKFLFRGPLDLCEQYKLRFIEVISCGSDEEEKNSGYRAEPLRKHADGQWTYVFEIYGPLSNIVRYLNWKSWSPLLQRMDVRWEVEANSEGVKALRNQFEGHGAGGRNVQTFNSRIRTKKDGRDAGGFGVAVGSHKSTMRFSAYKRGKEKAACEVQFSGGKIDAAVALINGMAQRDIGLSMIDPWVELRRQLFDMGAREMKKCSGLTLTEIESILETGTSDTVQERALRIIERNLDNLDTTGLEVALNTIQLRLALDC